MSLLLWATDVHLDHLPVIEAAFEFGRALSNEQPTAIGLVVTGDIAEAYSVQRVLQDLAQGFGRPVYFVLGNQDDSRRALCARVPTAHKMTLERLNTTSLSSFSADAHAMSS